MGNARLRILSFNTWLLRLPFGLDFACDIERRKRQIPEAVARTQSDIVCFQENWDPAIRFSMRQEMRKHGYAYHAESSGYGNPPILGVLSGSIALSVLTTNVIRNYLGNGLQIFSRYPLRTGPETLVFTDYTRPDEYFVRKGAILTTAEIPGVGPVDIVNAHLGAVTYHKRHGRYCPVQTQSRHRQLQELLVWIRKSRRSPHCILVGDLNFHFHHHLAGTYLREWSRDYALLLNPEGIEWWDTYRHVHGFGSMGNTDTSDNPYKALSPFRHSPDATLDYICVSASPSVSIRGAQTEFHPRDSVPLSDHLGVTADIGWKA